jgi:hypothetical protein
MMPIRLLGSSNWFQESPRALTQWRTMPTFLSVSARTDFGTRANPDPTTLMQCKKTFGRDPGCGSHAVTAITKRYRRSCSSGIERNAIRQKRSTAPRAARRSIRHIGRASTSVSHTRSLRSTDATSAGLTPTFPKRWRITCSSLTRGGSLVPTAVTRRSQGSS